MLRRAESSERARPALVCVLPHGASPEQRVEITGLPLEVQLNRLARFQPYYSTRDASSTAGDIADWDAKDHHTLPTRRIRAGAAGAILDCACAPPSAAVAFAHVGASDVSCAAQARRSVTSSSLI